METETMGRVVTEATIENLKTSGTPNGACSRPIRSGG